MSVFSFLPFSLSSLFWFLGCPCITYSLQPNILVLHLHRLHPESILKHTSSAHPCFVPQCSKERPTEFSSSWKKLFHFKFHLILADSFQAEENYIALSTNKQTDWMNSGPQVELVGFTQRTCPVSWQAESIGEVVLDRFVLSLSFSCHVSLYSHS